MLENKIPEFKIYKEPLFKDILQLVYDIKEVSVFTNDHLTRICPFFRSNKPFKSKNIFSMPFNYYYSPILDNYEKEFFNQLDCYSKEENCNIILKSLMKYNYEKTISCGYNSILELNYNDYDSYFRSLSKSFRQNIRTAYNKLDSRFLLKQLDSEEELYDFYKVMSILYVDKHHMVFQPFNLFKSLFNADLSFFLAFKYVETNNILACIVITKDKEIYHYNWGITDPEFYKYSLNTLLVDKLIKIAFEKGIKYIDFGATPASDEKLLFFKEKWGCSHFPVNYYYTLKQTSDVDLNKSYLWVRKLYSKMPKPFIRFMMPKVIPWLVS